MSLVIVDFQSGNLFSVLHAFRMLGINAVISSDPKTIEQAHALVLPGVGAFGDAMKHLQDADLVVPIKQYISTGKPFLGICLGLQLLFTESEEFGTTKGLDIIKGQVTRFRFDEGVKVPHTGWSRLKKGNIPWKNTLLDNVSESDYFYFVHSYFVKPDESDNIIAYANYEKKDFCAAIMKNNIFATQFHPEKSGKAGLKILKEFAAIVLNGKGEDGNTRS